MIVVFARDPDDRPEIFSHVKHFVQTDDGFKMTSETNHTRVVKLQNVAAVAVTTDNGEIIFRKELTIDE